MNQESCADIIVRLERRVRDLEAVAMAYGINPNGTHFEALETARAAVYDSIATLVRATGKVVQL